MNVPRGADRAISIGALAEQLGMSRRAVERALEQMVLDGIPVIANSSGVYITDSPSEARAYAASLKGRLAAIQHRISALERWADDADGAQEVLPWAA